MIINKLSEIKKILIEDVNNYSKIALLTHKNPDGDGFPACLALQEILNQQNIKSDIQELAYIQIIQGNENLSKEGENYDEE